MGAWDRCWDPALTLRSDEDQFGEKSPFFGGFFSSFDPIGVDDPIPKINRRSDDEQGRGVFLSPKKSNAKVVRFHETILSFGEPGSGGDDNFSHGNDAIKQHTG